MFKVQRTLVTTVVGTLAIMAGLLLISRMWSVDSQPLKQTPQRVVIFGIPGVGFEDINSDDMPNLTRLFKSGAGGAMSARSQSRKTSSTDAYTALGAGSRLYSSPEARLAYPSEELINGQPAGQLLKALTGYQASGQISVLGGPQAVKANKGKYLPSTPGALGEVLHNGGKSTAVIGNADRPDSLLPNAELLPARPATLALFDRHSMRVDYGTIDDASLLKIDPNAPFGLISNTKTITQAFKVSLKNSDVLLVDPGDLDRAAAAKRYMLPNAYKRIRNQMLRHTDEILGQIEANLPNNTLLITVAAATPDSGRLSPIVISGNGTKPGFIHSPSTKRRGLLTITDLAPTVLDALKLPVPDEMIGHPLRYEQATPDLTTLKDYDRDTLYRETQYSSTINVFIIGQAVLFLLVVALLHLKSQGSDPKRSTAFLEFVALLVASFPVSTLLIRLVPGVTGWWSAGGSLLLIAIMLLLTTLARGFKQYRLAPLTAILTLTSAVIVVDLAIGSYMHSSTLLSYSFYGAGRFYGLPNPTFAVLASASLLAACLAVANSENRKRTVAISLAGLLITIFAVGVPTLGADVGGILTLVPIYGLTALALTGRRVSWREISLLALMGVILFAVLGFADSLRPDNQQTHLGTFVNSLINDGPGVLLETVSRKEAANFRILGGSIWTNMIPIVGAFTLYLLFWQRRWSKLLPSNSPLRVGFIGVLASAVLGFLLNDSGPIVIALMIVFIGPLLIMLVLDPNKQELSK